MNSILNLSKKAFKTLFYIPIILCSSVLGLIFGYNVKKNKEGVNEEGEEENEITPFISASTIVKYITPSYYCGLLYSAALFLIKQFIKIFVAFGAFSIISLIMTLFAYYIISLPRVIENDLSLSFGDDDFSQSSYLYFNCTRVKDNCSSIEALNYQVLFEFEVVKNERSFDIGNFQVELNYMFHEEVSTVKKINFLETGDYYIETFFRIVNFPLRVIGYKKNELVSMNMINNLDNTQLGLDYIEIKIRNNKLNIKNPKVVFLPVTGYIRNLIWSMRIFTLPAVFFGFILIQFCVYTLIRFLVFIYNTVS